MFHKPAALRKIMDWKIPLDVQVLLDLQTGTRRQSARLCGTADPQHQSVGWRALGQ